MYTSLKIAKTHYMYTEITCKHNYALRLQNMANISKIWKVYGNNRDEDGAMGNGCQPTGASEKWGDLGGSKGGTDWDGHEKEKVGMVRGRLKKRWNRKHQEDLGCDGKTLLEGTRKPGRSGRNGPLSFFLSLQSAALRVCAIIDRVERSTTLV